MSITTAKIIDSINGHSEIAKQYWTDTTHQAIDTVHATATNVKNTLTQTANQAVETLNQTKNQVSQAVSETTLQGLNQITSRTNKAITTLDQIAKDAQITLTKNTARTLDALTQETTKSLETVNQATAQAKTSLDETMHRAENLSQSVANSMQDAVSSTIKNWLDAHPIIVWLVSHPFVSFFIFLLLIFIILGLFQALNHLVKSAWLLLLSSPQKLLQASLLGGLKFTQKGTHLLGKRWIVNDKNSNQQKNVSELSHQRISKILRRLEVIREEQDQLSRELEEILEKL